MTTEQHHFEYDGFTVQINDSFCIWEYRISTNDPSMCIDSFIQATKEKFSINVESSKLIESKPIFPSENKELGEAERVESDLNEMFDTKRIIDFAVWYSGMDRSKVVSAYKRYITEKLSKPVTPTDNDDTKI